MHAPESIKSFVLCQIFELMLFALYLYSVSLAVLGSSIEVALLSSAFATLVD